jgi:hypothetical protein
MSQWAIVVMLGVMVVLMAEARLTFGSRIARLERDMHWLIAGLRKWGLAAPGYDEPPRVVVESDQDQRPQEPPKRK